MTDQLLSPEVQKFIKDHQFDDPFSLSLNAKVEEGFPLKEAIAQIHSLQKAKAKLPSWAAIKNMIWPPPISIEQSSSEITASYKASLIHGLSMVDLTGGMGVDVSFFADSFEDTSYVEPDSELCQRAKHNFNLLGKSNIEIINSTAEDFLDKNTKYFDAIYLDPSRRSETKKVFKIEDCAPNLLTIVPKCLEFAPKVLVKLSPLADITQLLKTLSPNFIWVVSVKNEVKEVLCLVEKEMKTCRIEAVMLHEQLQTEIFKFFRKQEKEAVSEYSLPLKYLYEPNAAIMKAGAFKLIGKHYGLKKLHQHTHLYTSNELLDHFPGRILIVKDEYKLNKKEVHLAIPGKKINVITRNFPLTPAQLKKKLNLKDGGEDFLIGTTLIDGKKVLLSCKKVKN